VVCRSAPSAAAVRQTAAPVWKGNDATCSSLVPLSHRCVSIVPLCPLLGLVAPQGARQERERERESAAATRMEEPAGCTEHRAVRRAHGGRTQAGADEDNAGENRGTDTPCTRHDHCPQTAAAAQRNRAKRHRHAAAKARKEDKDQRSTLPIFIVRLNIFRMSKCSSPFVLIEILLHCRPSGPPATLGQQTPRALLTDNDTTQAHKTSAHNTADSTRRLPDLRRVRAWTTVPCAGPP
jgi:hypothetical protein